MAKSPDPVPSWDRLRRLRDRAGLSRPALAEMVGLSASGLQRYEDARFEAGPPVELVRDLSRALVGRGEPPIRRDEVWALLPESVLSALASALEEAREGQAYEMPSAASGPGAAGRGRAQLGAKDLPVYAAREVGGLFALTEEPVEWIRRPDPLEAVPDGFGFYVPSDVAAPLYETGDLVLVHPGRPARRGDEVFLRDAEAAGRPGRLVRIKHWTMTAFALALPSGEEDTAEKGRWRPEAIVGKYSRR